MQPTIFALSFRVATTTDTFTESGKLCTLVAAPRCRGIGGALETVIEGRTGTFFDDPTPESLARVLRSFDASSFEVARLRAHAETFAPARFVARLKAIVAATRG